MLTNLSGCPCMVTHDAEYTEHPLYTLNKPLIIMAMHRQGLQKVCALMCAEKLALRPGEELRQAAQVAIIARKDYGAEPKGQPLAKSHERALSEAAAARLAAAPSANSASLSDEDALPEEGDWGMDAALECERPASMPGGRATSAGSRLTDSSSLATHPRWREQLRNTDATLQSNTSTLQNSMPRSAELQAVPCIPVADGQTQGQGFGLSEVSHKTLDNSHANRVQNSPPAQPPPQKTDDQHTSCHCALPLLSVDDKRQDVQVLNPVNASRQPLAAQQESRQALQQLSNPCRRDVSLNDRLSAQRTEQGKADSPQLVAEQQCEQSYGKDTLQHSKHGLGPPGPTVDRTLEYCKVQAQGHDRHTSASCQSMRSSELQKLQALSDASDEQAPQWVDSGPADLSADHRLAQKLQQEELRWHQLHSKADTAKRKLKKESTLDTFFKRPAR